MGFTKISQDRSGGSDPCGQAATAESVERVHRKLCLEELRGIFGIEGCGGSCAEARPTETSQARSGIRSRIRVKYFPWFQPSQFIHELALCRCPVELCYPKLPGGDIHTGQSNDELTLGRLGRGVGVGDGRQEMRFSGRKEFNINQRPRRI